MERVCDNCMNRVPIGTEACPQCNIAFTNTNPGGALPNGWVLAGRYTVGRYMEIDGEGILYSAIDASTLQRVHLKEFMPVTLCATRDETGAILAKPGCEVLFKTTRLDYAEMYGILLRMGLVEGLVQVLDVFEENNTAYVVLEKVEGPTLSETMTRRGKAMEPAQALSVLRPVLIGVAAMHAASIVHRGISPENIILEQGGTARLGGFGTLALRQQGSELKAKLYPGYSAPEQYAASEFEGSYTDVYALGAVMYRLLTDEEPDSADERKVHDNLPAVRSVNKEVPSYLSSTLTQAMRTHSEERIQSVKDFRLALTGEGPRKGHGSKSTGGFSRQQLVVGGVALGAIVLILLIILLVTLFGGNDNASSSSLSTSSSTVAVSGQTLPDFAGLLYADITGGNSYKDFTFATPTEEYSDSVAVGRVISQTPQAGTQWDGNTPIQLVISLGPQTEEMPDLTGKTVEEAASILDSLGVRYREQEATDPGDHAEGHIVSTRPEAGETVESGDEVILYVSNKPSEVQMPNLVGLSAGDVSTQMRNLGINYNTVTQQNNGQGVPGAVASTSVTTGATINPQETTVTVTVWADVSLPSLIGMTMAEAQRTIDNLRSTASGVSVSLSVASGDPTGTVVSTNKDGQTIVSGDVIQLNMTPPAEPEPTPDPEPTPAPEPTPEPTT